MGQTQALRSLQILAHPVLLTAQCSKYYCPQAGAGEAGTEESGDSVTQQSVAAAGFTPGCPAWRWCP